MNRNVFGMSWVAILAVGPFSTALAADDSQDLATKVHTVFKEKCATCHGPQLAAPKGRFGYVLDLGRLRDNRDMVAPSSPDDSELWELVRKDEMPPPKSPSGALSDQEKESIRAWIAAGAPANAANPPDQQAPQAANPRGLKERVVERLGSLHLIVIHFPLALLIMAALVDLAVGRRERAPGPVVRFCVFFGAIGAVVAAPLGWIYASSGHGVGSSSILDLHRWIGIAAAGWSILCVVFSEVQERRGVRNRWFRLCLILGAVLVGVAGHFGGVLVHGDIWFG